jgi:predicted phage tail protein
LFNLMQLHAAVKGPVQELIDAIEELIEDLTTDLQELDFNFQQRTNEHNALVIALEQDIRDAESDVARMDDTINELLIPRRSQIKTRIAAITDNMDFNRKTLAEDTLLREQEHADYELQIEEFNEAIAAVDEALALLQSLSNPSASLIQIRNFSAAVNRISMKSWNRVRNGPIVKALVQLALKQNFSDQGVLGQIVGALNEFRNDIVDAVNAATLAESEAQADYEARVVQLDLEYAEFQAQLNDANIDLTATIEKIEECTDFLNQRELDRKQYVAQLNLENETYVQETEIYTDLKNEYLRELAVSEQAHTLVTSAEFGDSVNFK